MLEPIAPEIAFSHFVQAFANPSLDAFFLTITWLGNPALWFFLVAFLYWKGDEKRSFFLGATLLFAGAVAEIAKNAAMRPRPSGEEFRVLVHETGFALPSGHATTIAGVFGFYWEKFRKNARIMGLIVVLLVMLSRVYIGVHFLGDVIAGALFGFLVGRVMHATEQKFSGMRVDRKKALEELGLGATITIAVIISFAFRDLALASGLLGFFAGAFLYKILDIDSTRLAGQPLWGKEILGFFMLGLLAIASQAVTGLNPEIYFLAGAWISLIYPALWEKLAIKHIP